MEALLFGGEEKLSRAFQAALSVLVLVSFVGAKRYNAREVLFKPLEFDIGPAECMGLGTRGHAVAHSATAGSTLLIALADRD